MKPSMLTEASSFGRLRRLLFIPGPKFSRYVTQLPRAKGGRSRTHVVLCLLPKLATARDRPSPEGTTEDDDAGKEAHA